MNSAVRTEHQPPFPRPPAGPLRPPAGFPVGMPFQQQAAAGQAAPQQHGNDADTDMTDVTRMDSASLQDVIQYSGIDLRAEAEMIESELHIPASLSSQAAVQDVRMRPDYFFNLPRMKAIVYMVAKSRGITAVPEEVFELIGLALQRRLANMITGLSEISKHRVDAGRLSFKIKVENDPKKQLWLLEKVYEEQMDRLQQEDMMLGPSARLGETAEAKAAKTKKAAAAEKRAAGEDVVVKTRLANTTAMAALGLQQRSWMTAGIVGLQSTKASSAAMSAQQSEEAESQDAPAESVKIPLHFSQAPSVTPVTDRDLLLQLNQRIVSLKDLVFFCERDPHLARSPIMLTLYDLSNF